MSQITHNEIVDVSTALLQALRDPAFYPHPVDRVEVIETHISWIFRHRRCAVIFARRSFD